MKLKKNEFWVLKSKEHGEFVDFQKTKFPLSSTGRAAYKAVKVRVVERSGISASVAMIIPKVISSAPTAVVK